MFKPLKRLVGKYKPEKKDKDYLVFLKIKKQWKKEVTKEIQKNAKLEDFTNGVLKIKAKNPTWRNELVFLKDGLKKNFHQKTKAK
jgi:hypothetical protein